MPPYLAKIKMNKENNILEIDMPEISKVFTERRIAEIKKPAPVISSSEKEEIFFFEEIAEKNFEKKYVLPAHMRDSAKYIRVLFLI